MTRPTKTNKNWKQNQPCKNSVLYVHRFRRCLHDTRSSFIPVRLHPGSILSIYICLHDTNQNCIPERVIPERLHPGSRIGSKFSFQNEICLHVPPVSCKGGTGSFRYGNKQVDWLSWPADSCFRSVDTFTAFSFKNENIHVNEKQTMRGVLEWNSFRYHVNTTLLPLDRSYSIPHAVILKMEIPCHRYSRN